MTRLMRWLVPDQALTWEHRCFAWRFQLPECTYWFMYAGGLDIGYIRVTP